MDVVHECYILNLRNHTQDLVRDTYLEFCPRNNTFTSSSHAL